MKTNMNTKIIATLALSATLTLPTAVMAKVSGQCGNCHTMHNSQNGTYMASTGSFLVDGALPITDFDSTANNSLLRYGCVGCHTGANTTTSDIPFVTNTTSPGTATLAGGTFYWVGATDDNRGHNVYGIDPGIDSNLNSNTPPGDSSGLTWGSSATNQLTCAGTMGCHGDGSSTEFGSIAGGHHGSADAHLTLTAGNGTYVPGTTGDMANSYRMLNGIEGIEDDDWELVGGSDGHNVYSGVDRSTDAAATGTISSLCAKCHGDFHNNTTGGDAGLTTDADNSMSSPWVRHPTDFDMGSLATTSEYKDYAYSLEAPVASSNVATITTIAAYEALALGGLGTSATGDAIVTCISCHRAHGSPNADLLRWTYSTMGAHNTADTTANTGCFTCHTTKDDI